MAGTCIKPITRLALLWNIWSTRHYKT